MDSAPALARDRGQGDGHQVQVDTVERRVEQVDLGGDGRSRAWNAGPYEQGAGAPFEVSRRWFRPGPRGHPIELTGWRTSQPERTPPRTVVPRT